MGDLISRSELLREFSVNSSGDKIPEYDIDNFPVTLPIKDIKEMIRNQPKVSEQEIRNKAIDSFMIAIEMLVKLHGAVVLSEIQEIAEQMKETEEPFFNFDSPVVDVDKKVIRRFADWCYINGIDFSYMSTTKKSAKQFIDDVIERYSKEQMKEVRE